MSLTPRAKRVIDLAYDEARMLGNNYIGTEHLLLGLIREGEGLAARVLHKLNVDLDKTRREVSMVQEGPEFKQGDTPNSESTRHTSDQAWAYQQVKPHIPGIENVQNALRSARQLSRQWGEAVDVEHVFLAILQTPNSKAARALASLGITPEQVEQAIKDQNSSDESGA